MGLRSVGIGAGEQHQQIGAGAERAPRLHAVDQPARVVAVPGRRCRHLDAGDVRSVVGLGDGDRVEQLRRRHARQPPLLLLLRAPLHQGTGEDLRPGDQRPAGTEGTARQLLGRDDHPDVLRLAACPEAAVLLGDREAEGAHLAEPGDDLLGDVGVVPVDVLRDGLKLVLREPAEGVLHELEVVVEVAGPGRGGEGGDGRRVAPLRNERPRWVEGVGLDRPHRLSTPHARPELGDGVGDERARDGGLGVALGAVVEEGAGCLDRRRGVGDVVGEDLGDVRPAGGSEGTDAGGDDLTGGVDGGRGGREVRSGHGTGS
jgi:hypothetical protein